MNKKRLALLGKVFEAEIDGAMRGSLRLFQTKAKLAEMLVEEGMLVKVKEQCGNGALAVMVEGYELTHLGRATYCANC